MTQNSSSYTAVLLAIFAILMLGMLSTPAYAIVAPDEICNDDIDNDFDELIDCADSDCFGIIEILNFAPNAPR